MRLIQQVVVGALVVEGKRPGEGLPLVLEVDSSPGVLRLPGVLPEPVVERLLQPGELVRVEWLRLAGLASELVVLQSELVEPAFVLAVPAFVPASPPELGPLPVPEEVRLAVQLRLLPPLFVFQPSLPRLNLQPH